MPLKSLKPLCYTALTTVYLLCDVVESIPMRRSDRGKAPLHAPHQGGQSHSLPPDQLLDRLSFGELDISHGHLPHQPQGQFQHDENIGFPMGHHTAGQFGAPNSYYNFSPSEDMFPSHALYTPSQSDFGTPLDPDLLRFHDWQSDTPRPTHRYEHFQGYTPAPSTMDATASIPSYPDYSAAASQGIQVSVYPEQSYQGADYSSASSSSFPLSLSGEIQQRHNINDAPSHDATYDAVGLHRELYSDKIANITDALNMPSQIIRENSVQAAKAATLRRKSMPFDITQTNHLTLKGLAPDDLCWEHLNPYTTKAIAEVIQARRSSLYKSVRKQCKRVLTVRHAAYLLSGDEGLIHEALRNLYAYDTGRNKSWIDETTLPAGEIIAEKMSEALGLEKHDTYDFLFRKELSKATAMEILKAGEHQCRVIAERLRRTPDREITRGRGRKKKADHVPRPV
ncbi:hypothetical protein CBS101457_000202 [Exobasidium rhododendri]|nr:hypothetical protein CBS101457_000202 [Exobasidium rhododendri]